MVNLKIYIIFAPIVRYENIKEIPLHLHCLMFKPNRRTILLYLWRFSIMEIICGIYKITSPSKKIYIGQSRDILHRFKNYYRYECKGQTHLYSSLKKHSIDKHKFEILEQCLPKELNDKEIYYIELYQCFNSKFGLNLMSGGSFGTHSVETKRKIGEATKRIHTGLKRSQSTKDKIREKALGRKISQETIQKIKETRIKNGGYHHSQETIEKIKYSNIN